MSEGENASREDLGDAFDAARSISGEEAMRMLLEQTPPHIRNAQVTTRQLGPEERTLKARLQAALGDDGIERVRSALGDPQL